MNCDEPDWDDYAKRCPKCGGDVHTHFGDYTNEYDYYLIIHCHICGESYGSDEWDEMEIIEEEGDAI